MGRTLFSHMSTNHDTTKDVKQADNSKLENIFHTKRKIVKHTHDGEWVDYCPSPITKPSNRNIASKSAQEQERFSCELCEFKCNSERMLLVTCLQITKSRSVFHVNYVNSNVIVKERCLVTCLQIMILPKMLNKQTT